jgi:hypothetical protein
MTDEEKTVLVVSRMFSGEPFTYAELGTLPGLGLEDVRLPDKLIQKHRKPGLISFTRGGGGGA